MVSFGVQNCSNQVPERANINWPGFQPAATGLTPRGSPAGCSGPGYPQVNELHVWATWLDVPESARAAYQKTLSPGELERAARFHFTEHRNRFVVGRGWLRQLLASYLNCPAADLRFDLGKNGKPALASPAGSSRLQFNLAHSDNLALVAVAQEVPVGVDVEQVRAIDELEELVSRFFSKAESRRFSLLAEPQRNEAFFKLWTRKEAWLKATGEGIAHRLNQVEVSFWPGEPARLLKVPEDFSDAACWSLCDLSPAAGYAAAVAVPIAGIAARCRCWEHGLPGLDL